MQRFENRRSRRVTRGLAAAVVMLSGIFGCTGRSSTDASGGAEPSDAADAPVAAAEGLLLERVEIPAPENLLRLTPRIYTGGEPHGDEAFAALADLGVRTVVSVDGARPDIDRAGAHGLRYVHIPIGYDGVDTPAGEALARLVREAEPPIYIHCHHGRHRGPAAAAVACIAGLEATNEEARRILEVAGTSESYAGLWRDVATYRPPPPDAILPALVEVAEVGSFAAAMASVDRAYDNLKLCRDAGWETPADHPDLVASQEALILREGLFESGRALAADSPDELRSWLAEAEESARDLRAALEASRPDAASERFEAVVASCRQCHAKYRN